MNDSTTNPDNAENRPETGSTATIDVSATSGPLDAVIAPSGPQAAKYRHGSAALDILASEVPIAETAEKRTMLVATADMRGLIDRSERLAQLDTMAEPLIAARHDLLVEVDKTVGGLAIAIGCAGEDDEAFVSLGIPATQEVQRLLDRLVAYLRGQDDRVLALGDALDQWRTAGPEAAHSHAELRAGLLAEQRRVADLTTERDALREMVERKNERIEKLQALVDKADPLIQDCGAQLDQLKRQLEIAEVAAREAGDLVRESLPSVRLVNDWATWKDANLYAYVEAHIAKAGWERKHLQYAALREVGFNALAEIRKVARDRLGDDGFTIPPTYTDVQREAAITALAERTDRMAWAAGAMGRFHQSLAIDAVAQALGMRRAGA